MAVGPRSKRSMLPSPLLAATGGGRVRLTHTGEQRNRQGPWPQMQQQAAGPLVSMD